MQITGEDIQRRLRQSFNWQAVGKYEIHNNWLKSLTSLHPHLAIHLQYKVGEKVYLNRQLKERLCLLKRTQ